jgi:hypothetical protein
MTPLLYAARHDRVDVAKLLIKAGADVNAKEANGIWPLLLAVSNDNMEVARLLLERGSAVRQDWYGRSPLWRNHPTYTMRPSEQLTAPVSNSSRNCAGGRRRMRDLGETSPFRHHLPEITGSLNGWISPGRRR